MVGIFWPAKKPRGINSISEEAQLTKSAEKVCRQQHLWVFEADLLVNCMEISNSDNTKRII
jgi:hypothetical protein